MRIDRTADQSVELRNLTGGDVFGSEDSIYMLKEPPAQIEDELMAICLDDGSDIEFHPSFSVVPYPNAVLNLDGEKRKAQ